MTVVGPTSRYAGIETAQTTVPDGVGGHREVRYLRRGFPPQPSTLATLTEHVVTRGDRLDVIAARYLGDPTLFWRVCDAHLVTYPDELTAEDRIGERLRVPIPYA